MGGKSSRESTPRSVPRSHYDRGYSHNQGWNSPSYSYSQESPYQSYPPPPSSSASYDSVPVAYPPPPQSYASSRESYAPQPSYGQSSRASTGRSRPTLDRRYSKIADDYQSLEQVTEALAHAGLESSNLIVGIDFTKSNEWTGKYSFNHRSLHHIGDIQNPYEQAISIIGRTLSKFDEDNLIPCFGFGDASTHDQDVFSFYVDERPCNGFSEALERYREIVPQLRLAGPTSFAPIIEMAMTIVEQSGGQYHVLLIIADGQVTRSVDIESGQLSSQEQKTVDAIVKASQFPLSIILVGVGDGPWDMMKEFDDNIPARSFDNFQFVNFTQIMSKNVPQTRKETEFALAALMEIPLQYRATLELGFLGNLVAKSSERVPLPPPVGNYNVSVGSRTFKSSSFQQTGPSYSGYDTTPSSAPLYSGYDTKPSTVQHASNSLSDNLVCPICLTDPKDMAFGCGHQTCCECGQTLESCPICRSPIVTRIKLY
ncbi:E3 ubiquitin-protein ligase RGLG protein [Dioscorea alata]|uniref:E3 ubiquitin-protein ligase RGLG protein n=1 Tax=Dioscorea alata TaxID=55571 RepID=A0ACB7W2E4_DIOAL|nr:E3 ubiquitin-protein ligase RGLG protein [Dioscorea alata]